MGEDGGRTSSIAGLVQPETQRGGAASCESLLESFQPSLVRVARRQFRLSEEDARDLVQEIMASWLSHFREHSTLEYNGPDHLYATLHRMLIHRFIDRRRRPSSQETTLTEDVPSPSSMENLALLIQQKALVKEELSRLSERRVAVLRSCLVEGLTQEEASEKFGVDRRLISEWKRKLGARLQKRAAEIGLYD